MLRIRNLAYARRTVNRKIAQAIGSAPESIPALWMQLRDRWEYGHVVGFVLTLTGFGFLVISLLAENSQKTPPPKRVRRRASISEAP